MLSISVSGVPLDATLSAGTNNGGGNWTLTAAQLVGLKLNAGETAATLHVTATNTTTGEVASSATSDIAVTVNPGPEAPSLAGTVLTASGVEGTAIPLTITATPVDGDDVLSISVSGVPLDATLSAGTNNGGGNWTLTAAQLVGLKLNAGETAATLHVTATNTTTGEVASSATSDIAVTVNPLAENPVLGEASASVTVSEGSQGNALGLTAGAGRQRRCAVDQHQRSSERRDAVGGHQQRRRQLDAERGAAGCAGRARQPDTQCRGDLWHADAITATNAERRLGAGDAGADREPGPGSTEPCRHGADGERG